MRNKKLISIITLEGIIFGILFAFLNKKTWQGEFQIVLQKENNQNSIKDGDIIFIEDSIVYISSDVIGEITAPLKGIFASYLFYKVIKD